MTRRERAAIAAAIREVAISGKCDHLTLRALVQQVGAAINAPLGFRADCTGVIDLSGRDWLSELRGVIKCRHCGSAMLPASSDPADKKPVCHDRTCNTALRPEPTGRTEPHITF